MKTQDIINRLEAKSIKPTKSSYSSPWLTKATPQV